MTRSRQPSARLESLERRSLMTAGSTFVYVESNNPVEGQNAVLAYRESFSTGLLSPLPTARYLTGGTGYRNAGPLLGPDDSDKEVVASPDGKFLFAVNQGSDTITVFAIGSDGSLSLQADAPFPSGGVQPVSLSFSNDQLFVVNRGNSAEGVKGTVAPNVTSFFVGESGRLIPVPSGTVTLPLNLSTAQVLTSADGKFAFVDNFATPSNLKVSLANTVEPFVIGGDGSLSAVAGGAAGLPANPPLVLGLAEDPAHHIVYTGQAPAGGVATFSYDDNTGKVKYVSSVASEGKATCWLNLSPDGKFLYATDSASDAISVYSLTNPYKPALIQEFDLKGPSVRPGTTGGPTSQDFQFSLDPTGKYIWVLNHTTDDAFQQGNQLHTIDIASNGKLSEPESSPIFFPTAWVPTTAHVLGLAVVTETSDGLGFATTTSQIGEPTTFSPFSDGLKIRRVRDLISDAGSASILG